MCAPGLPQLISGGSQVGSQVHSQVGSQVCSQGGLTAGGLHMCSQVGIHRWVHGWGPTGVLRGGDSKVGSQVGPQVGAYRVGSQVGLTGGLTGAGL